MERVGVVVHPTRPVFDSLEVVEQWAAEHGLEVVRLASGEPRAAPSEADGHMDVIVPLGGDGTILKALHKAAALNAPVLGVAYGSLGALTTVPREALRAGLDRFAAGAWRARTLPGLEIRAGGSYLGCAF